MAQNTIVISSDSLSSDDSLETLSNVSSDSGTRQIPTKPVTQSNKTSTFPAKHRSDNEETSLKQPHQNAFTSKQETFEIIKRLHIKCGFLDTENLLILPKKLVRISRICGCSCINYAKFLYAYCTPKYCFAEKYFKVGIPKSMVLIIIFRVFMWPLSLRDAGPRSIIHLQRFKMVSQKI